LIVFNIKHIMRSILIIFFHLFSISFTIAQTIYSKSYGKNDKPAIFFIHGGPSGNATLFECTTAQRLADSGYYVIVYDRRGEGRSIDTSAQFTFQEAINDLNALFDQYKLDKATIIAHSFGGIIATLFTEQYPDKVKSLILAGALINQQQTYDHILKSTKRIYKEKADEAMLSKIKQIEKLDKQGADYRKACFDLASENGFFKMPYPTEESEWLRKNYESSEFFKNNIRNQNAPRLFYQNEKQTNINTTLNLKRIQQKYIPVYAIYGIQDRIFSTQQLMDIQGLVGQNQFKLLDNCSHYLFVDKQKSFVEAIKGWVK
jgi:proline iminopeptidase